MAQNPALPGIYSTDVGEALTVSIPPMFGVQGTVGKAFFQQLCSPAHQVEVSARPFSSGGLRGILCRDQKGRSYLFVPRRTTVRPDVDEIIVASAAADLSTFVKAAPDIEAKRIFPLPLNPVQSSEAVVSKRETIRRSWSSGVQMTAEEVKAGITTRPGLRPPQIGALHALLAHWTVTSKVATVVMPTGTGKTETMIAATVMEQANCLLVVVPSDALRTQIALAFSNLGILRGAKLIAQDVENPVVAVLRGRPKTVEEVNQIFGHANVIVTTMASASGGSDEVQDRMAGLTSHMFVDEAHHIAAKTWQTFRQRFQEARIVQFTATPFRNDGRRVDGKFVFSYPLRLAQDAEYFKPLKFIPITAFDRERLDYLIARKVGETLKADQGAGFPHLAMARCRNRTRAEVVHKLYEQLLPHRSPVLLHSGLSKQERALALRRLNAGDAQIVVCVDMLGEGFDLPQLKIAGLHDPKKSEAPTLQFIGRFIRGGENLGEATVIAGTLPDDGSVLSRLYAEDADWNRLIREIGTRRTEGAIRREEVFQGFEDIEPRFPLETLRPRMSAVVFRTSDTPWDPNRIHLFDRLCQIVDGPFVNQAAAIAIFVMRITERPKWTSARTAEDVTYDLVMLYWNQETELLYIHSTSGDRIDELAEIVCGAGTERIRGEQVFRAMSGLKRPVLNVLGLSETRRRRIRHTQLQGTDIAQEVKPSPGNRTRAKTNFFVMGFDEEGRTTVGCSRKGKVWSYQSTNDFAAWADWCDIIGGKLTNSALSTDELMNSFITPELIKKLPVEKTPVGFVLSDDILGAVEERWTFSADGLDHSLLEVGVELASNEMSSGILFNIHVGETSTQCRMLIGEEGMTFEKMSGPSVIVQYARKSFSLEEWFVSYPPTVYFADGDALIGDELLRLPSGGIPGAFPSERMVAWDWTGVDIRTESWGPNHRLNTVQGRVIERMVGDPSSRIVFDDDGAGEAADVVVVYDDEQCLRVVLYHCKYSKEDTPGNRIGDLYEVCGQAQQSIRWCEHPKRLFEHLLKREVNRLKRKANSGFAKGTQADLKDILARVRDLPVSFEIIAVQPGYSKIGIQQKHMQVLATTQALLMETFSAPFTLICSK